jgi:choloylglycine hydrolase
MDLGGELGFNVLAIPKDAVAKNNLSYISFNPAEAGVDLERFSTGGMNSAGLSCDMQTLVGSLFPKPSPSKQTVQVEYFCSWVLSQFVTVQDLKTGLNNITVTDPTGEFGQHFVARDAKGQSLVMEFTGGEMQIYEDLNDDGTTGFGIMTNEPTFDYHLKNIKHLQWKRTLTRQSVEIPGAFYPEERFMRLYMVRSGLPEPKDYQEAVIQAVHVLNTVTVPMGEQYGTDSGKGEGQGDHTQYGVIYDHANATIYWRSSSNQNLQRLRMADMQLEVGSPVLKLPAIRNDLPWFVDAASSFRKW